MVMIMVMVMETETGWRGDELYGVVSFGFGLVFQVDFWLGRRTFVCRINLRIGWIRSELHYNPEMNRSLP